MFYLIIFVICLKIIKVIKKKLLNISPISKFIEFLILIINKNTPINYH